MDSLTMIVNFRAGAQPQLGTGSSHPILAGYGFLQAPDVAFIWKHYRKRGCRSPSSIGPLGCVWRRVRDRGDCRAVGARRKLRSKIGTGLAGGNTFYDDVEF